MNPVISAIQWLVDPDRSAGADRDQLLWLAETLGISLSECLAIPKDPGLRYRAFTIKKKSGGRRKILAPSGRLKKLQRALLDNVLGQLPTHWAAMAFRKGMSVVDHAQMHAHQQVIVTVDLRDFFGCTTSKRVASFFADQGYSGQTLKILTRLTTFEGSLPQGAPTSPALSNVVNYQLDARLHELAILGGGIYSRYCDDLAFSWSDEHIPVSFSASVMGILDSFGYQVQEEKGWRVQRIADGVSMPGIVIKGNRLRPADDIQQRIRAMKRRWYLSPAELRRAQGYLGYVRMLRRRRW